MNELSFAKGLYANDDKVNDIIELLLWMNGNEFNDNEYSEW